MWHGKALLTKVSGLPRSASKELCFFFFQKKKKSSVFVSRLPIAKTRCFCIIQGWMHGPDREILIAFIWSGWDGEDAGCFFLDVFLARRCSIGIGTDVIFLYGTRKTSVSRGCFCNVFVFVSLQLDLDMRARAVVCRPTVHSNHVADERELKFMFSNSTCACSSCFVSQLPTVFFWWLLIRWSEACCRTCNLLFFKQLLKVFLSDPLTIGYARVFFYDRSVLSWCFVLQQIMHTWRAKK